MTPRKRVNLQPRFSVTSFMARRCPAVALAIFLIVVVAGPARAETSGSQEAGARPDSDPAAELADALIAACRQDPSAFATHLTAENADAFRALPQSERIALLRRFVLLDDPGKPLLSANAAGHAEVRCEAGGVVSDLLFGETQMRDNLAFITVEVPEAGSPADNTKQSVRFGLVRESGQWKLLSLGLLLLDIPALARGWQADDISGREAAVISSIHEIADALKSYQQAYGKLPETLAQLGPPGSDGASPDAAGLLDAELKTGEHGGYRFRYTIVPVPGESDESERDKAAGFEVAATPIKYGESSGKSFYLDSKGVLRGADKRGNVADADDPRIAEPASQNQQP